MTTLAAALLGTALQAAPARADDGAAGDSGLKAGVLAPTFMLPVVNEWDKAKRWGPAKWSAKAEEPKKLVILSFFATWCEPCKKEMPELVRLDETYRDQGLGLMMVSIDKGKEQRDAVVELAKSNKVTFPVLHDRFQVVARRYDAERLPYMLMVGPDGVIRTVHVGYTDEVKANLENEVRAHLGLEPLPAKEEAVAAADKDAKSKKDKAAPPKGKKPAKGKSPPKGKKPAAADGAAEG